MQKILPVLLAAFPFRFFSATQSARHRQPVFCFILGALMSFVLPSLFADTFTFTGAGQNYLVPAGVVQVSVKLWGGGGGGGNAVGGGAGFSSGTLTVTPGESLTVIVAGGGGSALTGGSGGFGGGGIGGNSSGSVARTGGGGGRSALQRAGTDLVAAGGGGGGGGFKLTAGEVPGTGGPGGGTNGTAGTDGSGSITGTETLGGGGGTASAGGAGSAGLSGGLAGASGSLGTGGAGGNGNSGTTGLGGGGGGGGYFGGGGAGGFSTSTRGATGGGGGGSSLAGPSGITTSGSGTTPGNTGDTDYIAGVGVGGATNAAGGNGRVITIAILAPEIVVEQPAGTNLVDGTASIGFGNVAVGANGNLVFTIKNTGSTNLTGLGITIDGTHAAMFTVTTNPVAPVSAGGSTTFTVRFAPTSAGAKTAALHIANNDGDENPFDINLTGTGTNSPPTVTANNSSVSVNEGGSVTNTGTFNDLQGNATVSLTASVGGVTKNDGAGTWTWICVTTDGPDQSQTVIITATDGLATNTTSFTLTVNNVAPTAVAQSITTPEDKATNIVLTATDPGTDTITNWTVSVSPTNGTLSGLAPNLTYSPNTNFHGGDSFKFTATDSDGATGGAATVTLTVLSVNDAPVPGPLTNRTVNPGTVISFNATATDADTGDVLSFSLANPPANASITGGGAFLWRPRVAQAGTTNTVTLIVTDNGVPNLSGTNSFTVIVNPLAPVLLTPVSHTNGGFQFAVGGTTGPDYVVVTSTNLVNWTDSATNLSPVTPFQFNDAGAGSSSQKFYRARLQP